MRGGERYRGGRSDEEDDEDRDEVNGDEINGDVLQWHVAMQNDAALSLVGYN